MQNISAAIFLLCIGLILCISTVDGGLCFCGCCAGFHCDVVTKPTFSMTPCNATACSHKCKEIYPADCGAPVSQSWAACKSAASDIFYRSTTFATYILAFASTFSFVAK
ncbi:unnamed protein product [Adineta ricciae]|uniref:Uncharacterized protein n=1 Tax=Adineta ricciae TaxID=249248 RepID=A0A815P8B8_ADIRI|nr:unnamed protein product [Adineta ricciae]CAF1633754.1 unnamed protein product [Adineta ricciae]